MMYYSRCVLLASLCISFSLCAQLENDQKTTSAKSDNALQAARLGLIKARNQDNLFWSKLARNQRLPDASPSFLDKVLAAVGLDKSIFIDYAKLKWIKLSQNSKLMDYAKLKWIELMQPTSELIIPQVSPVYPKILSLRKDVYKNFKEKDADSIVFSDFQLADRPLIEKYSSFLTESLAQDKQSELRQKLLHETFQNTFTLYNFADYIGALPFKNVALDRLALDLHTEYSKKAVAEKLAAINMPPIFIDEIAARWAKKQHPDDGLLAPVGTPYYFPYYINQKRDPLLSPDGNFMVYIDNGLQWYLQSIRKSSGPIKLKNIYDGEIIFDTSDDSIAYHVRQTKSLDLPRLKITKFSLTKKNSSVNLPEISIPEAQVRDILSQNSYIYDLFKDSNNKVQLFTYEQKNSTFALRSQHELPIAIDSIYHFLVSPDNTIAYIKNQTENPQNTDEYLYNESFIDLETNKLLFAWRYSENVYKHPKLNSYFTKDSLKFVYSSYPCMIIDFKNRNAIERFGISGEIRRSPELKKLVLEKVKSVASVPEKPNLLVILYHNNPNPMIWNMEDKTVKQLASNAQDSASDVLIQTNDNTNFPIYSTLSTNDQQLEKTKLEKQMLWLVPPVIKKSLVVHYRLPLIYSLESPKKLSVWNMDTGIKEQEIKLTESYRAYSFQTSINMSTFLFNVMRNNGFRTDGFGAVSYKMIEPIETFKK